MIIQTALLREFFTRVVAAAVLTVVLVLTSSQLVLAQSGGGFNPLSPEEVEQALSTALQSGVAGGADSELSAAAIEQEVLLVERHQSKKSELQAAAGTRQGDVYVYDYTTDTLKHAIVNLNTNETISLKEVQNVQLPLTEREVARALEIIFEHERLRSELSARFRAITGEELTSTDQFSVKAFIFRADSMPDRVNELSAACGLHRCAQVLLYTDDDTILEIQPIVDLSRELVTQEITENLVLGTSSDAAVDTSAADNVLIANENVEESLADLSSQPQGGGDAISEDQSETAFLPFVGRNRFKNQDGKTLTLDQQIYNLWCTLFGGTWVDEWFGGACSR